MALHFGLSNSTGSEHTIAGRAFPAEVRWSRVASIHSILPYILLRTDPTHDGTLLYSYRSSASTLNCIALTVKRWTAPTVSWPSQSSSR